MSEVSYVNVSIKVVRSYQDILSHNLSRFYTYNIKQNNA